MLRADCLCLPTFYPVEGQPICILEAYGSGCAVVCTTHAGISDIFKDEVNGFACKQRSASSIMEAFLKVKANLTRFAIHNHTLFLAEYTEAEFVHRVQEIFFRSLKEAN